MKINAKYKKYVPYIILLTAAAALTIRAFYGFCWSDETFYLSTTRRFFDGDLIFADEWFPTQLSSVILLPFYAAFVLSTGGTSGIILYFRILYVILSLISAVLSFRIIRTKYSVPAALSVSLFIMFFAHLNIATMSYYTLSFQFFVLAMLLISMNSRITLISGGFLFALAVLCLPSLAVGYFAVMLLLILWSVFNKNLRRPILLSFAGIAAAALIFLIYLYASGDSLTNIFRFLPFILSDEEHQTSLVAPFKKFFTSVSDIYGYSIYLIPVISIAALLSDRYVKLKKYVLAADTTLFAYYFTLSIGHTGYINTAFALFSLPLFCMLQKKDLFSFFSLFLGGLAVSMTYSYSSNGELYVMTIGHGIACVASILFLDRFIEENQTMARYIIMAVIAVLIIQTGLLRFTNIYRDAPADRLNTFITEGPAAGLRTTSEHAALYNAVLKDIRTNTSGSSYVFFSKLLPWGYLVTDAKCGAPTTWRTNISSKRLELYYSVHPERIPETVFIMNADVGAYDSCGDIEADPAPNENELSGWFMDYMKKNNYSVTETGQMTIRKRPR